MAEILRSVEGQNPKGPKWLKHLLRRCKLGCFGGLNPFSGGTWTLREKEVGQGT